MWGVIRKSPKKNSVDAAYVRFLRSLLRITLRERVRERERDGVLQAKNVKCLL